jgi:uncharacterized membrane protein required for colicin V production
MGFDLVDLVILAATLIGIANGYRRGFWLSAAQYAGLVGGVLLGAAAATPVLNYLEIHNPGARPRGAAGGRVLGASRSAGAFCVPASTPPPTLSAARPCPWLRC